MIIIDGNDKKSQKNSDSTLSIRLYKLLYFSSFIVDDVLHTVQNMEKHEELVIYTTSGENSKL